MAEIKTKKTVKNIRTLDKVSVVTEHIKDKAIRTKSNTDRAVNTEEHSADEYAINRVSEFTERVYSKSKYQFDRQGRKRVKETKDNISIAKERYKIRKENAELKKQTQGKEKANDKSTQKADIKTRSRDKAYIKTRSSYAQKDIKTSDKSFKTFSNTKSTQNTVNTAQKSYKSAKNTAQTTQKTAKSVKSIKEKAQATSKGVKAAIKGAKALKSAIVAGGWVSVVVIVLIVVFGGVFALLGSDESNSYTPVSAEVEAYEPIIQLYAKQHGIPEYVELIKAVMMQESGGKGSDPMQSSECPYNKKYPNKPNAITDAKYSINVGIEYLANCLKQAEVSSPIDIDNIKLALQGYNFGNGYISWAKKNYGGYSYANAVEFSVNMCEKLNWDSYGDTQYVSHVLRYYPFGKTTGSNDIVEVARSQIGNVGGEPYWSWYGFNSRVEWCACFVSWCANECGYIDAGMIPKFSYCVDGVQWFKDRGQWKDRNYTASPGDIIFFDWEGDGHTDHTGIVEKVENGKVYTIEGNSNGDCCKECEYTKQI